jgi:hypothetical protein
MSSVGSQRVAQSSTLMRPRVGSIQIWRRWSVSMSVAWSSAAFWLVKPEMDAMCPSLVG